MQGGIYAFCEAVKLAHDEKTDVKDVRCRLGPTQPKARIIKGNARVAFDGDMEAGDLENAILEILEGAGWGQRDLTAMRIDAHNLKGRAITGLTHSESRVSEANATPTESRELGQRADLVDTLLGHVGTLTNSLNENCRIMRQNSHSLVTQHAERNAMLTRELELTQLELRTARAGGGGDADADSLDPEQQRAAYDMFGQVFAKVMGGTAKPTAEALVGLIKADPESAAKLLEDPRVLAAIQNVTKAAT